MFKGLWSKFKAGRSYDQTKGKAKGAVRKYEQILSAIKRLEGVQGATSKAALEAFNRCVLLAKHEAMKGIIVEGLKKYGANVSRLTRCGFRTAYDVLAAATDGDPSRGAPTSEAKLKQRTGMSPKESFMTIWEIKRLMEDLDAEVRVRINPDRPTEAELALLEAVARYVNTRNELPSVRTKTQAWIGGLEPGIKWITTQAESPELQFDETKQAALLNYIDAFEAHIEKLEDACEVERRVLDWIPTQGPESPLKRFSDNGAWFYAALESILPPPLPGTTRVQAWHEEEQTMPSAPKIKQRPVNERPADESTGAAESKPNPPPPTQPAIEVLQAQEPPSRFEEAKDEANKMLAAHDAALELEALLSDSLKQAEERVKSLHSVCLFEARLALMRGIDVSDLENSHAFLDELRSNGLKTAFDIIVYAANGPIQVGLRVSTAQLLQRTKISNQAAYATMHALAKALDDSNRTLRLRIDPDSISTNEKTLLEDVARYINVRNGLPEITERLKVQLLPITSRLEEAKTLLNSRFLATGRTRQLELISCCTDLTPALVSLTRDYQNQYQALLTLPKDGPMEVVRRFSENNAWFYATLDALIATEEKRAQTEPQPRATPQSPQGRPGYTGARSAEPSRPSLRQTQPGFQNPKPRNESERQAHEDDPDRPTIRPAQDRTFVPYDWGTPASDEEDDDETTTTRARRKEQVELVEYAPLPGSSDDRDQGHVPLEIAQAVEALELKRGPLKATLRRYQMFGAQFMIQQQRTLLGDDMGLGKTVQALAAMCHLHAEGRRRFLVVAPNSVLINWEREVAVHTGLKAFVIHGQRRSPACMEWLKEGGVGITTYDTVGLMLPSIDSIDMLAVDEAHKVKNPKAKRTLRIKEAASKASLVALMSGTALENRISELHALVCMAQPDIKQSADYLLSSARPSAEEARRRIAKAYLRRTQADVLSELPEITKVDEYVTLNDEELDSEEARKPSIQNRRIATTIGTGGGASAKYTRLRELLEIYEGNRDKVVIFSAFRQVLDDVSAICGGCEQITGEVPPSGRMNMIDRFKAKDGFGCLALQVDAGGQGLNIQFARVVILMEPQFKPSTENQAIARVHRMGQGRKVIVHRLIAKDSIDEDLVELIKYKQQIFDQYAHQSAVKDESGMAVDSAAVQKDIMGEALRRDDERRQRRAQAG